MQCPDCYSVKIFLPLNEGDGKCATCYGEGLGGAVDQIFEGRDSNCLTCGGNGVCQTCGGTGVVEGSSDSNESDVDRDEGESADDICSESDCPDSDSDSYRGSWPSPPPPTARDYAFTGSFTCAAIVTALAGYAVVKANPQVLPTLVPVVIIAAICGGLLFKSPWGVVFGGLLVFPFCLPSGSFSPLFISAVVVALVGSCGGAGLFKLTEAKTSGRGSIITGVFLLGLMAAVAMAVVVSRGAFDSIFSKPVSAPSAQEPPRSGNLPLTGIPLERNIAISKNDLLRFVTSQLRREESHQIDAVMASYASRVKYFQSGVVDAEFIRRDKNGYFDRWQSIGYSALGDPIVSERGSHIWSIAVPAHFLVVNRQGKWINGDVLKIFEIDTGDNQWLITGEHEKITRRERGEGRTNRAFNNKSVVQGTTQAIGGGVFDGKGTVYRIPELKGLVGKTIRNGWLYGEFAFERAANDVAVCRAAATVLFAAKGSTVINIEFLGGLHVSSRVLESMKNPSQPVNYMLRAGADNPIKLINVRRNVAGILQVQARSPIRLEYR